MAPNNVPNDAITNDASSDPHRRNALPRTLVPSRSNGVARVRDKFWRKALAGDPPGGSSVVSAQDDDAGEIDGLGIQSTLDSAKERAMADTGAPNSLPIVVVLPRSCAREATNDKTAMLPHESDGDMTEEGEERGEEDAKATTIPATEASGLRTCGRRRVVVVFAATMFGGNGLLA
jgi:hypothetical protein